MVRLQQPDLPDTSLFGPFLITLKQTAAVFICRRTKSHVFLIQIRVQLFDLYHSFYICTDEADYPGKINTSYLYYCITCTLFMQNGCWSLVAVWEMYVYVWLKPSALCGSLAVADLDVSKLSKAFPNFSCIFTHYQIIPCRQTGRFSKLPLYSDIKEESK